jgi:hypothetical protein
MSDRAAEPAIDYQRIVQEALRGIVRRVLGQVAEEGLPGDHHFYISFRTTDPGVFVPKSVRDQYPEEMVIVLQHQFWGLEVDDEAFSVQLNFNARRQTVTVPWPAITAFADPVAEFALRFEAAAPIEEGEGKAAAAAPVAGPGEAKSAEVLRFDPTRKR